MLGHLLFSSVNRGTSFLSTTGATYVLMNNQTLLRTSYPELSFYWPTGSFGSTSGVMVIPDVQDLVFRGVDIDRGADETSGLRTSVSGVIPSGLTVGSYQVAAMPSHVHISGYLASGTTGSYPGASNDTNWGASYPLVPIGGAPVNTASTTDVLFHNTYPGASQSGTLSTAFTVGGVTMYPYICVAA